MAASNKPSPFSVASGQFATCLRTVQVETTRKDRRDANRMCFSSFESPWHRFLRKTTDLTTLH